MQVMWMLHIDPGRLRPVMDAVHVCVLHATMDPVDGVQLPRRSLQLSWLEWVRETESA